MLLSLRLADHSQALRILCITHDGIDRTAHLAICCGERARGG